MTNNERDFIRRVIIRLATRGADDTRAALIRDVGLTDAQAGNVIRFAMLQYIRT